jgi:predicted RNase H-like HicB family nuclease
MTTTHEYRGYLFRITHRPADPAYSVDFPDIPDIITSGSSLNEAFSFACEALDVHLESLQKLGMNLPKALDRLVVEAIGS